MEQDLQSSTTGDTESADYSDSVRRRDSRVMETFMADKKINERKTRQQTIKLAPIPALEELSTPAAIVHRNAVRFLLTTTCDYINILSKEKGCYRIVIF